MDEKTKQFYRENFEEVQFKIDSYVLFIIKGLLLTNNGDLSYIIPNTLLNNYFLATLRKKIVSEMTLKSLINFDNSVFDAVVHSLIVHIQKIKPTSENKTLLAWNLNQRIFYEKQENFLSNENFAYEFEKAEDSLLAKLRKKSVRLEEILDLRQAIKSGNDKKYITPDPNGNAKLILRGKDIGRYSVKSPNLYLDYGKHLACPRDEVIFNQPHILIREAGRTITATLDRDNFYIMSSLYCGIMKNSNISIEYMIGLINSKLFQHLMYKINFENTQGAFTKAKIYHYNQLPVVIPTDEQESRIKKLVNSILELQGLETQKEEDEIDVIIYEIYELSADEISIVEENQ